MGVIRFGGSSAERTTWFAAPLSTAIPRMGESQMVTGIQRARPQEPGSCSLNWTVLGSSQDLAKVPMKILLAVDDRDLTDFLCRLFQWEGYTVITAPDGEATVQSFTMESPDLIVLDLTMSKDTSQVLRQVRQASQVPILILTDQGDEEHLVEALKCGADDYLAKPLYPGELKMRAKVLLRRASSRSEQI
jgi:CheY-like chemotaxis protein